MSTESAATNAFTVKTLREGGQSRITLEHVKKLKVFVVRLLLPRFQSETMKLAPSASKTQVEENVSAKIKTIQLIDYNLYSSLSLSKREMEENNTQAASIQRLLEIFVENIPRGVTNDIVSECVIKGFARVMKLNVSLPNLILDVSAKRKKRYSDIPDIAYSVPTSNPEPNTKRYKPDAINIADDNLPSDLSNVDALLAHWNESLTEEEKQTNKDIIPSAVEGFEPTFLQSLLDNRILDNDDPLFNSLIASENIVASNVIDNVAPTIKIINSPIQPTLQSTPKLFKPEAAPLIENKQWYDETFFFNYFHEIAKMNPTTVAIIMPSVFINATSAPPDKYINKILICPFISATHLNGKARIAKPEHLELALTRLITFGYTLNNETFPDIRAVLSIGDNHYVGIHIASIPETKKIRFSYLNTLPLIQHGRYNDFIRQLIMKELEHFFPGAVEENILIEKIQQGTDNYNCGPLVAAWGSTRLVSIDEAAPKSQTPGDNLSKEYMRYCAKHSELLRCTQKRFIQS